MNAHYSSIFTTLVAVVVSLQQSHVRNIWWSRITQPGVSGSDSVSTAAAFQISLKILSLNSGHFPSGLKKSG